MPLLRKDIIQVGYVASVHQCLDYYGIVNPIRLVENVLCCILKGYPAMMIVDTVSE